MPTAQLTVPRSERRRNATIEEIKSAAITALRAEGPAAVTFSAVAREMEIVPSALYRYFPDRQALIDALVYDAYDGLSDALEHAVTAAFEKHDVSAQSSQWADELRQGMSAFRNWALSHPAEFGLIYGQQAPAYQVTEDTLAQALRPGNLLFRILAQAQVSHAGLRPPSNLLRDALLATPGHTIATSAGAQDAGAELSAAAMLAWFQLYGAVAAEVFGNFPPSLRPAAAADELFAITLDSIIANLVGRQ